jgi:hypothetical protein
MYELSPWNRVIEEFTVAQLVKKLVCFYGTRKLMSAERQAEIVRKY